MTHLRPLVLGLAAVATLTLSGCNSERELGYKDVEIDEYKRQISELENQLYKKDAAGVHDQVAKSGGVASTENIKKQVGPDVDVSTQPVEVVLSIESEVLFKSGSATLSAQAKSALNKVVATINEQFKDHDVRVVGHTDDQKITRTKNAWEDNWDLSAGRAREVLLYLESRGIDGKRLGLAGYGQERPRVPNTSTENKQKNRRVEIVVIPKSK